MSILVVSAVILAFALSGCNNEKKVVGNWHIKSFAVNAKTQDLFGDNVLLLKKNNIEDSKASVFTFKEDNTFFTSAIHLESNVNLEIEEGATLKFTKKTAFYQGQLMGDVYGQELTLTRFESVECMNYSPFIYAYGKENIAVTGKGTLDGSAEPEVEGNPYAGVWHNWRLKQTIGGVPNREPQDTPREKLFMQGQKNIPVSERIYGESKSDVTSGADDGFLRPNFVQPYKCNNVIISGVKIIDSPMWEINPVLCNNVLVDGISINSHMYNNDGCDPECSNNVVIRHNTFDVGDDCLAIKSGRNGDGLRINVPTTNVVIYENTFKDGHGGITIGSEITAGVYNVYVHDNVLDSDDLEAAYRFKTNYIRGGQIKNVFYGNDTVKMVKETKPVILVDLNYDIKKEVEMMKALSVDYTAQLPGFFNVKINNLTVNKDSVAKSGGKFFFQLKGFAKEGIDPSCTIPEDFPDFCYVENFSIFNSCFYGASKAFDMEYVDGFDLYNCKIDGTTQSDSIKDSMCLYFNNCDFTGSKVKESALKAVPYSNVINCKFS